MPREELAKLVNELQDTQHKLERKNIELRNSIQIKEQALKKYADHYDFAPVGYLSLDVKGCILAINLTGCHFLGEDRQTLINKPVTKFLDPEYKNVFREHIQHVFNTGGSDACQVKVQYKNVSYDVELRSVVVKDEDTNRLYCRSSMFNISGKLEIEAALDEQRKLTEAVFEHIETSILFCNKDGVITIINKAAKSLFGAHITGLSCEDWPEHLRLYAKDGVTPINKEDIPLYKAWKGETMTNEEINYISPEGYRRILLASGQPVFRPNEINPGAFIAMHDITDRKTSERNLQTYQQQLEKLVEDRTADLKMANTQLSEEVSERSRLQKRLQTEKYLAESIISSQPGLFFLIDRQGRMHRWNKNMEIYSGFSKMEIKNMMALDLLHKEDVGETKARLNNAFQEGKAVGKARVVTKEGQVIPFLLTGVAVKLGGEEFVIGTGIDITASEKERMERMRFFQILEKSMNEIYIFDAVDVNLIYVNEGARKNLGYPHAELMGMKAFDLEPEITEVKFQEIIRPLLKKDQEKIVFQTIHEREDGSRYPIEVQLQLIEEGDRSVFVAMGHDITDRLKADEQLRTSLREKEVLLGEIHHRVKNNLSIISALLTIQAGYVEDRKVKNLFKDCESRVKSMGMIHEMLYRQENFDRVDFGSYLRNLINHISSNFKSPDTTIHTNLNIDGDVSLDISTAVPCALVINELITNAYKHAFKGRNEGTINVSLTFAGEGIELTVEDDGIGLPSLTDSFNTMGMTLINGLTAQLKGTVALERVEKGSKFKVCFSNP